MRNTRHVTARLPATLVEKIDAAAQKQTRTRSQQLKHDLTKAYADSEARPIRKRDQREQ